MDLAQAQRLLDAMAGQQVPLPFDAAALQRWAAKNPEQLQALLDRRRRVVAYDGTRTLAQAFRDARTERQRQRILADPERARRRLGLQRYASPERVCLLGASPQQARGCRVQGGKPAVPLKRLAEYDRILVGFSGGKDSIATVLDLYERLVDEGIDPRQVLELWHHNVDGGPDDPAVFDWACTEAYCRAVADHLGLPLLVQYRKGGIYGEMKRDDACTQAVVFQRLDGSWVDLERPCTDRRRSTRRRYPQVGADLGTRWCTAYAKVMVAESAITNDARFDRGTFMLCTGERREESNNRARYAVSEPDRPNTANRSEWSRVYVLRGFPPVQVAGALSPHLVVLAELTAAYLERTTGVRFPGAVVFPRSTAWAEAVQDLTGKSGRPGPSDAEWALVDRWEWTQLKRGRDPRTVTPGRKRTNRYFDRWRPVIDWTEHQVWTLMRRWGLVAHPCYHLGYSRASCQTCIFLHDNDWSSLQVLDPGRFELHVEIERWTGFTMARDHDLSTRARRGVAFVDLDDPAVALWRDRALSEHVGWSVVVEPEAWTLPAGAFRESGGPE